MTNNETPQNMTDAQATDEAMLLLTRKLRRLHPEAFASVWAKLPEGAHRAIYAAENRADLVRSQNPQGLAYPADDED